MHDVTLVNQVLHPIVRGFDLASHVCKLEADDGVVDELLAESAALVSVLDGLFVADAGETNALNNYAYPLVVEVCHDD